MRPIIDIPYAYCPMGCGHTLHLMPNGMIVCLAPDCPDQGAAQKILGNPEHLDVVEFTDDDGFTILHPLRERLGDLFACPVNEALSQLGGAPEGLFGRYRVSVSENVGLSFEKVPD